MYIGFDGKLIKSDGWYAIEIPALLVFTQAKTLKEGLEVASGALGELLSNCEVKYDPTTIKWVDRKKYEFRVYLPLNQPSIAFILRQIRGYKEMSLADVAKKMNAKSKNAVAAYERTGKGGREPTIGKLNEFFETYGIKAELHAQL